MSIVVALRCNSYKKDEVGEVIKRGFDLLGGITSLFSFGEKILLKPNILVGDNPEKSVTTHPIVMEAIAEHLIENSFNITYGDSPGFGSLKRASERSGIKEVMDKLNVQPADFETIEYSHYQDGLILKKIPVAKGVIQSDAIISVSKMKTHGFTRITGAVKNQFGCVPGLIKGEFHVKMPDILDFSKVLVDINKFINPRLYIMDGIVAMEGNGPRGGNSVDMNTILLSRDPIALDAVFCKLINLNPEYVPTMKYGLSSGLGTYIYEDIEIVGDKISTLVNKNFNVVRKPFERFVSKKSFPVFLKNLIAPKPVIDYDLCKNCGKCVLQCPTDPKAVDWDEKSKFEFPVHDYKKCIRCYCCQEMCPYNAITIQTPLLGKLIRR